MADIATLNYAEALTLSLPKGKGKSKGLNRTYRKDVRVVRHCISAETGMLGVKPLLA